MAQILTVSMLNTYAKSILDGDGVLSNVRVEGEISNYKKYPSGHGYFTLKDRDSQVRSVIFATYLKKVNFKIENGIKVIVRGRVSLYERDGAYQLYAENMFLSGEGEYRLEFERIKTKLSEEGLFDHSKKKPLPKYPFTIGVVTSEKGAAFHDIVSVLQRRFPCVDVLLSPCLVQGDNAEQSIIDAIDKLDTLSYVDIVIITRGGGSKEDLWVFNSEKIARRAAICKKPTISAIGHEIDFSILDFICDARAATPTAAAEIAVPDRNTLMMDIKRYEDSVCGAIKDDIMLKNKTLKSVVESNAFSKLKSKNSIYSADLEHKKEMLNLGFKFILDRKAEKKENITELIEKNNPISLLKRGYAVITENKKPVKNKYFTIGDIVKIETYRQNLDCKIIKLEDKN